MDRYEYREKTEQILQAAGEGNFERAAAIADTIQWERCRNVATLCKVSSIYERTGQFEKSQQLLFVAYALAKNSKKIVYQLGILAVKMGKYSEAQNCYEEFVSLAPKDPNRYILEYKLLKAQCAPIQEQIAALEAFKSVEYLEEWGYELAQLYHQAGMDAECVEECDDLILWFSESRYVYKAMELKMQHRPLSDLQNEKYIRKFSDTGSFIDTGAMPAAAAEVMDTEEKPADEEIPEAETVYAAGYEPTSETVYAAGHEPKAATVYEAEYRPAEETVHEAEYKPTEAIVHEAEYEPIEATIYDAGYEPDRTETNSEENDIMLEESEVGISEDQKITDSLKIDEILNEWDQKQSMLDTPEEEEPVAAASEPSSSESELDSILSDEVKALMAELEAGLDSAVISGAISMSEEEKKIEEEKQIQEETQVEEPVDEETVIPEPVVEAEPEETDPSEELAKKLSSVPEQDTDMIPEVTTILDEPSGKKEAPKMEPEEDMIPEPEEVAEPTIQIKKPVPQDTGFIIEARYDLEATSEIGTRVGLTEEQKQIFSYFVPVRGMSEQIVEVLSHDKYCRGRAGSSRTGNILVIGHKGCGKTVLAVDVVKAIQKQRQEKGGKVAIVNAASLNKKNITDIFLKLKKGALIIEEAGKLHPRTVEELNVEMEKQTGEMLVILEEERDPLKSLLRSNVRFAKKFTAKLEVPTFTNDELVTFAQTYAKENGFKLDDLAILALYSRIDTMQKESHAVSITEVKDILDEAMNHSKKSRAKKFVKRLRGKNEDEEGRIILNEHDFV